MKKYLVVLMMVGLMFGGCASLSEPAEAEEVAVKESKPLIGFDFGVSGDVFFPLTGDRQWKLVEGVSLKIATLYEDMFAVNVVMADFISDRDSLYGAGVTVNIPKVFEKLKGNWVADIINPSIGLAGLIDLNPVDGTGMEIIPSVHLSIIRYEFQ